MKQPFHDEASARLAHTEPSSYDQAAALVRQNGWTIKQALQVARQRHLSARGDERQQKASPRLEFLPSSAAELRHATDSQTWQASAWDRNLQTTTPSVGTPEDSGS